MAAPVFVTNDVPTAAQVNDWFVNTIFVRKGGDESLTSNTTLQDDDSLQFTVAANASFEMGMLIRYTASTTGDFKFAFAGPASSACDYMVTGLETAAGGVTGTEAVALSMPTATGLGGLGATVVGAYIKGLIVTGGTAGTFKLQWAQNTSDATATIVKTGSFVVVRRVA